MNRSNTHYPEEDILSNQARIKLRITTRKKTEVSKGLENLGVSRVVRICGWISRSK